MALRGFDHLGASAAMHSATTNSFKVTGSFRDASDFCVLMLWDVDDFYGHPCFKYLPDSNFDGLTLSFDVEYSGLQPLDSNKYPTIDWPYLDAIRMDETNMRVNLFEHATQSGGSYTPASATFSIINNGLQQYDRVSLWYRNIVFDHYADADDTAHLIALDLAGQINRTDYTQAGAPIGISAQVSGNEITVTATKPGMDGNMIRLYQLNKNSNLLITPAAANLAGGSSSAVWHIELDFAELQLGQIRKLWLTFAPPLANGAAYAGGNWEATFTNWIVTGPENVRSLQVAGPSSLRIRHGDPRCSYSGTWSRVAGFYDHGFATRATALGSTARVRYFCGAVHDLYIGTLLAQSAGVAGIQLDGDPETDLKCALGNDDVVIARRRVRSNVPPGAHDFTIVLKSGPYVDFNFLEAALPSDVPSPPAPRPRLSAALDFDTDHTYKLPPARVLWTLDQLGFAGSIDEYLGVFWWNQRINSGGLTPSLNITFGGTWAADEVIFLKIGAPDPADPTQIDPRQHPEDVNTISKSVFPADTPATIAAHFAAFINGAFSGIWASAAGPVLTVTCRSAAYAFAMEKSPETTTTAGTITFAGTLAGGIAGEWTIDPGQAPTLNTGTRAWHADFYEQCHARGLEVVTAISMELVNPPPNYSARFHDGAAVTTATGFGEYRSSHCAVGGPVLDFQKSVLADLAAVQANAGLTPCLQFGEFLWWFFSGGTPASMAFYDPDTQSAASSALGRPLHVFTSPADDPQVNGGADATFLRNRLLDHISALIGAVRLAHPNAQFELLLPLDVNYAEPVGPAGAQVGGRLNHFVNIPPEWLSPASAGFDYLKIEALAFGSTRNLELARGALQFGSQTSWPGHLRRYLVPVFGKSTPWPKEVRLAITAGYSVVNLWALDHICLYGWSVSQRALSGAARARFMG